MREGSDERQLTPGFRLVLGVGTALLSTLLCVLVVELALQIAEPQRFYPYHPNATRAFYPSEEVTPGVSGPSYFTTNSFGTRGPELSGQPVRILTVGGSTTACTALDDSETWPALLMRDLNERGPEDRERGPEDRERETEDRFWVTNSGIDGKNSHHHLMHAKYLLPELPRLDYVIFYAGLNDVGMWLYVTDWDSHYLDDPKNWANRVGEAFRISRYSRAKYPWYMHSRLWKRASMLKSQATTLLVEHQRRQGGLVQDDRFEWMEHAQELRQNAPKELVQRAKMATLPDALDSYAQTLERTAERVRQNGAEPIFMLQAMDHVILTEEERRRRWMGAMDGGKTYVEEEQMRELLEAYNDRMRRVAREQGALYIDLPELLGGQRGLFYDGHHFNERGARAVARAVADFLWTNALADRPSWTDTREAETRGRRL